MADQPSDPPQFPTSEQEYGRAFEIQQHERFHSSEIKRIQDEIDALDKELEDMLGLLNKLNNIYVAAKGVVRKRRGNDHVSNDSHGQENQNENGVDKEKEKKHLIRRADIANVWEKQKKKASKKGDHCESSHHEDDETTFRIELEPDQNVHPIGMIYTPFRKRFEAPRQSFQGHAIECQGTIHFDADHLNLRSETKQMFTLAQHSSMYIWVIYWLDRNREWRLYTKPPRRMRTRVGVFATRSPNRPTPIGISLAKVVGINESSRSIEISGMDILDETPLLGFIPYHREFHCYVGEKQGWLSESKNIRPLYYDKDQDQDQDQYQDQSESGTESEQCDNSASNFEDALGEGYALAPLDPMIEEMVQYIAAHSVVKIREMLTTILQRPSVTRVGKPFDPDFFLQRVTNSAISDMESRKSIFDKTNFLHVPSNSTDSVTVRFVAVGSYRVIFQINTTSRAVCILSIVSGIRRDVFLTDYHIDPEIRQHANYIGKFFPELHRHVFGDQDPHDSQ